MSRNPDIREIKAQYQREAAKRALEELFGRVRDKCFDRCITKPGTSLSRAETQCVAQCVDRYIESNILVGQSVVHKGQKEAGIASDFDE